MTGRLRKFLALDGARRRLFLRAFSQLRSARRALGERPFRELVPLVEGGAAPTAVASSFDRKHASDIGWAVRTAARYARGENACLVQVLAARAMLQEAGIAGTIYIGAERGAASADEGFAAHAWLKCGDMFVTGEAGHERYTVVGMSTWGC